MKTKTYLKMTAIALFGIASSMSFTSCAPVFSEMQTAKTLEQGEVRVSPTGTTTSFSEDGESESMQKQLGLLVDANVAKGVDARFKYEAIFDSDWEYGEVHALGLGLKFGLVEDQVAFSIPFGMYIDSDGETGSYQLQPSVLLTHSFTDKYSMTFAPKSIIMLPQDEEPAEAKMFGFNINAQIDLTDHVYIMPEFGMLFHSDEGGHFRQFSIGIGITP
jgi:hypothetical protein